VTAAAPVDPDRLAAHLGEMDALAGRLEGHLTPREVRFLSLLGAAPTAAGDILEIGSFKGKSTILLARSAAFAGAGRVVAVDPLILPSVTDPRDADPATLPALFRENLRANGVADQVDFHQMTSRELGTTWDRPIRLLWIDGDHTWDGARLDFDTFARFVPPGGIVALHDVLNRFDGPIRVLCERMLESDRFAACGLVGSIGWAQVAASPGDAAAWAARKRKLRNVLVPLSSYAAQPSPWSWPNRFAFKLLRARVPHDEVSPREWLGLVRPR
jgi:predicted O-methyltransferase YrrM